MAQWHPPNPYISCFDQNFRDWIHQQPIRQCSGKIKSWLNINLEDEDDLSKSLAMFQFLHLVSFAFKSVNRIQYTEENRLNYVQIFNILVILERRD